MEVNNRQAVLRWGRALSSGTGLAGLLFGVLMLPSYGAGELAEHGAQKWQVVGLAGVTYLILGSAGLFLAKTGWQPRWPWVAGGMALAGTGLLVPLVLPLGSPYFVPLAAVGLGVFAFGAGFAQLAEQTETVAGVGDEERRSAAVGAIMRWHLLAGIIMGGIPLLLSWQVGQVVLAITFVLLAVTVAVRRRDPNPRLREPLSLGELYRLTGPAAVVVAVGQAAWTAMWWLPGLHGMSPVTFAWYAIASQLVAWLVLKGLEKKADKKRVMTAGISGFALLLAIVGVAVFPAVIPIGAPGSWFPIGEGYGAGFFIALACFVVGETAANFFIISMEGHLSVEIGGLRSQLLGHTFKFYAVGVAGVVVPTLAGILTAWLGAEEAAIPFGVTLAFVLGLMFWLSMYRVRVRNMRLGLAD